MPFSKNVEFYIWVKKNEKHAYYMGGRLLGSRILGYRLTVT